VQPVNHYKKNGDIDDLKEVMECAVSALCGKWLLLHDGLSM